MRLIQAWWHIVRGIGSAMRAGRQADQLFRYYVIQALEGIGFFDFLHQPRSYGEILTTFNFQDNDYTQEVLVTLHNDSNNVISLNSGSYVLNVDVERKSLEEILKLVDKRFRPMALVAENLAENILERMREEKVGVEEIFTRDEHRVTNMFNDVLGTSIYTTVRNAVFAYLPSHEKKWLRDKALIELGCGSGRETAELWTHLKGRILITGVDPVRRMVELAEENFEEYLVGISPNHPPIVSSNRPKFKEGNAVELPFEDNSFDAAFWSFMLHWTSDPRKVIEEAVRVVRPGGLIFGAQQFKPYINPFLDLVVRSSRNSYGFFWKEEYIQWFAQRGLKLDIATPAGIFRVRNTK